MGATGYSIAEERNLEGGKLGVEEEEKAIHGYPLQPSMLQRLNPTNPLRIFINNTHPNQNQNQTQTQNPNSSQTCLPQQQSVTTLNSRAYTNKLCLFLFLVHLVCVFGLVCFLIFKGVQALVHQTRKEKKLLEFFLPQAEASLLLSITLAFSWQKAIRTWPGFMSHFILWSTFIMSLSAGILLICFQKPSTDGLGVVFIAFAIGVGLYACWVTPRIKFSMLVLKKSLEPVSKFSGLNRLVYWVLLVGFTWMSMWVVAVIGALNFYYPPLVILGLVLSLAWTSEVMRNVSNLTVCRAIALFYLRGMQANTQFCFQRAMSKSLGSACFGSLFVPAIEALRIVARGLNLLEGEDEFMFSCAHCCLRVMESIFRYGNGWAFVQIAAYGKSFVRASQDTWEFFEQQEMVSIVDSDITSSLCFLTGVCSGSICVIVVAAWTFNVHKGFTATVSLLAFFVGYLMTRISMTLPHACVSCYYVCYAENPNTAFFKDDKTIRDRIASIKSGREMAVHTPRVPRNVR